MSSPHVAGITALIKQKHPSWSPMAIKSALMTTAYQTTKTGPSLGKVFGAPFDFGAGHVAPLAALHPGLVLSSLPIEWTRFTCGIPGEAPLQFECPECIAQPALCNPRNLNTPAIAVAQLAGRATVTRTFTSVLSEPAQFTASIINNPPGFAIAVTPASFSLAPGASISVEISITHLEDGQNNMVYGQYKDGSITLTSGTGNGIAVRVPVVVRAIKPALLASPMQVTLEKRVPKLTYQVTPGFTGLLSAVVLGLQPARVIEGTVKQFRWEDFDASNLSASVTVVPLSLPSAKWRYIRIATFNEDDAEGTDLDLWVDDHKGRTIAVSGNVSTTNEEVNLINTSLTSVTVYVIGWSVPSNVTPFKLHVWTLTQPGPASSNTLWVPTANQPKAVAPGDLVDISLTFQRRIMLSPKVKWLGAVVHAIKLDNDTQRQSLPSPTLIYLP